MQERIRQNLLGELEQRARDQGKGDVIGRLPQYQALRRMLRPQGFMQQATVGTEREFTTESWYREQFSGLMSGLESAGVKVTPGADEPLWTNKDVADAQRNQVTLLGDIKGELQKLNGGPGAGPKGSPRPLGQPARPAPGVPARLN